MLLVVETAAVAQVRVTLGRTAAENKSNYRHYPRTKYNKVLALQTILSLCYIAEARCNIEECLANGGPNDTGEPIHVIVAYGTFIIIYIIYILYSESKPDSSGSIHCSASARLETLYDAIHSITPLLEYNGCGFVSRNLRSHTFQTHCHWTKTIRHDLRHNCHLRF